MLPPKPIRVLVAESHEMARSALTVFVETFEEFLLVGEAKNGGEALSLCSQLQPDVVLMSLNLQPSDGLLTTRMIAQKYPHVHVIVLTSSSEAGDIEAALLAGASSCLVKEVAGIDQLALAVRMAVN